MSSYTINRFKTADVLIIPKTPSKAPSTPRIAPELRIRAQESEFRSLATPNWVLVAHSVFV